MKKTAKWLGVFLAILIVIGILAPSETGENNNHAGEDGQKATHQTLTATEATDGLLSTSKTALEEETVSTDAETPPDTTTAESTPDISENSTFRIHFIDVGQADAALVECDGHYMLIDGGNKADSNRIYTVLKNAGVSRLDYVVGTHAHEDHIGGLPGAFSYATADMTLCPVKNYDSNAFDDFAAYAAKKGGGITVPKKDALYLLGSATVKILGVNSASDTNNTSIVLRIDYGSTSFLFTGDAEREAEQMLLNSSANLKATVLKVGHHGSETSTTYPFLREIMPKYAVVSVGKGNSYGHPTEAVLSRLRDAEVEVYRTDLQGDIFCISDGEKVQFSVSKNSNADVFGGIGENSIQNQKPENIETKPQESPLVSESGLVWIPKSGKKYHSKSSCSNMKNPSSVTKQEAVNRGYTPCKKCW